MIKGFEQPYRAEPIEKSHWQGMPAMVAGLIAGMVLLIVPHASPWEGLTSFTPAIMGRVVPATWGVAPFVEHQSHYASRQHGTHLADMDYRKRNDAAVNQ